MEIDDILNAPFTFTKRRKYTPCDTRPLWKSCLIVLILGITGNDQSASLKKIHTSNWIVKNDDHLRAFMDWGGKDENKRPSVRLEPALDRVIDLLVANEILERESKKIKLTEAGGNLFAELSRETIFLGEKQSLSTARKHLSEAAVDRLFTGV